jgi:hypothetical protein
MLCLELRKQLQNELRLSDLIREYEPDHHLQDRLE